MAEDSVLQSSTITVFFFFWCLDTTYSAVTKNLLLKVL